MKRGIIIVLDSVGIGAQPDAGLYGDEGSNTLGHIHKELKDLPWFSLANLERLGLGHIDGVDYLNKSHPAIGSFARMMELSKGKDTTTGHWEIAGIVLDKPFPVYPDGFPTEIMQSFEEAIGRKTLGNFPASGTQIIADLGAEHMKTGFPIVYTSADSVFQIAAHEEVIPLETLYDMCQKARRILTGEHAVGRVIARPFLGSPGDFRRTENRRDFSLTPIRKTILNYAAEHGYEVRAVGKIEDIFNRSGITHAVHTGGNMDGVERTLAWLKEDFSGILFVNLVDFDMLYGHRNNVEGYGKALTELDGRLPEIINAMKDDDILFITADHGCDPSTESTDHSREYTPLLVYGKKVKAGINLGTRKGFSDIAATIAEYLDVEADIAGESFLSQVLK
ncbi:MAG: phosphopentomutase [Clostridiaceae bacterium]|jgi:phosphopentomutase|nr:phosphopentomutase [Bacillota bacterium]NLI38844.1 phosphopentomutase [Clostridiaceae bacterium]